MSKVMEQAPNLPGSPSGRADKSGDGQQEKSNQTDYHLGSKELGILVGIFVIMVGVVGYGIFSQRSSATEPRSLNHGSQPEPVAQTTVTSPVQAQATAAPASVLTPSLPESRHADIYFDFGKSRLRADATATLQQQAQVMKIDGNWAVLIQGYADQHGPATFNKNLALRRAEAVRQFLVELGVPTSSMRVVSLGKESAICGDEQAACQRLNRRVHVEMVQLPSMPAAAFSPAAMDQPAAREDAGPSPNVDHQISQEISSTSSE